MAFCSSEDSSGHICHKLSIPASAAFLQKSGIPGGLCCLHKGELERDIGIISEAFTREKNRSGSARKDARRALINRSVSNGVGERVTDFKYIGSPSMKALNTASFFRSGSPATANGINADSFGFSDFQKFSGNDSYLFPRLVCECEMSLSPRPERLIIMI